MQLISRDEPKTKAMLPATVQFSEPALMPALDCACAGAPAPRATIAAVAAANIDRRLFIAVSLICTRAKLVRSNRRRKERLTTAGASPDPCESRGSSSRGKLLYHEARDGARPRFTMRGGRRWRHALPDRIVQIGKARRPRPSRRARAAEHAGRDAPGA